jgi:hypothetical protein
VETYCKQAAPIDDNDKLDLWLWIPAKGDDRLPSLRRGRSTPDTFVPHTQSEFETHCYQAAPIEDNNELHRLALDSCKGRRRSAIDSSRIAFALEGTFDQRSTPCAVIGWDINQGLVRAPHPIWLRNSLPACSGHRRQRRAGSSGSGFPQRPTTDCLRSGGCSTPHALALTAIGWDYI